MTYTGILGIDPGLDGALALYRPEDGSLIIKDVPTLQVGKKRVVDHYALAGVLDCWAKTRIKVVVEFVSASPQMGVVSAFSFGETYGLLRGVCAAHFLRIETVTPAQWKREMRVKGDKDESRARASQLFPRHANQWALKKHDGRAEAALIALWGAEHLTSTEDRVAA